MLAGHVRLIVLVVLALSSWGCFLRVRGPTMIGELSSDTAAGVDAAKRADVRSGPAAVA